MHSLKIKVNGLQLTTYMKFWLEEKKKKKSTDGRTKIKHVGLWYS
jgi:hypothetical protein